MEFSQITDRTFVCPCPQPINNKATLATRKWGQSTFRVMSLAKAVELKNDPVELQVVVTPGKEKKWERGRGKRDERLNTYI